MICLRCGKYLEGDRELERELGLCNCPTRSIEQIESDLAGLPQNDRRAIALAAELRRARRNHHHQQTRKA